MYTNHYVVNSGFEDSLPSRYLVMIKINLKTTKVPEMLKELLKRQLKLHKRLSLKDWEVNIQVAVDPVVVEAVVDLEEDLVKLSS